MQSSTQYTELVSIAEVCKLTTLGRTALWKMEKSGEFPSSFILSGRRKAFVRSEVEDWIRDRIAERDSAFDTI